MSKPLRVGFVTSHPIQYQAPVFRCLSQMPDLDFEVLFCHQPSPTEQGAEFGVAFQWDVPILDGYRHRFLKNVAIKPSVMEFAGCDTPEIRRLIGSHNFDVIGVNGWVVKSCLQTLSACRKHRVPCVVRGEANVMRPRAWWKRWLHRRLLRRYAAFACIGSSNREFYRRAGARDEQLFFSPYCIENERFTPPADVDRQRAEVRERWGVGTDEVVFLYSGKFIPKKHPLELLQSLANAHAAGMRARLVMIGAGELKDQAEHFVQAQQLPVTFTGFVNQSEIVRFYHAADCLVLPSDHGETWGLVVNEAMASGLPAIVSSQVGCGPDLIKPGQSGSIFPFGDWPALTQLLLDASRDPVSLRRQGKNAQQLIAGYSPAIAAQGLHDAFLFAGRHSDASP